MQKSCFRFSTFFFFNTVTADHLFCTGRVGHKSRRWQALWGVSNFLFHGTKQGHWRRRNKGMLAAGPLWDMGQEQHRRGRGVAVGAHGKNDRTCASFFSLGREFDVIGAKYPPPHPPAYVIALNLPRPFGSTPTLPDRISPRPVPHALVNLTNAVRYNNHGGNTGHGVFVSDIPAPLCFRLIARGKPK